MVDQKLHQLINEWLLSDNTVAEAAPLLHIRKHSLAEQSSVLLYALGLLNDHQRSIIAFLNHLEAAS